jgi:hypothetical protein
MAITDPAKISLGNDGWRKVAASVVQAKKLADLIYDIYIQRGGAAYIGVADGPFVDGATVLDEQGEVDLTLGDGRPRVTGNDFVAMATLVDELDTFFTPTRWNVLLAWARISDAE